MTYIHTFWIAVSLLAGAPLSHAASHAAAPATSTYAKDSTLAQAKELPPAQAEVRKIDLENKKITLKHGEIKNLNMPGMTMVFVVKDAKLLDDVKPGDKVNFTADHVNGVFTVLTITKSI